MERAEIRRFASIPDFESTQTDDIKYELLQIVALQ